MRISFGFDCTYLRSVLRIGLVVALFCLVFFPCLSPAQVVINELMYHPYEPFGETNDHEFIEIYNAGTGAVDLGNYRFDNGISYNFPTNTFIGVSNYIVLCENFAEFSAAYPSVTNCIGTFSGSLNNGGERITLSRKETDSWETVDTISYVDIGLSDGNGPSLELVNPGFGRLRNHCYGAWAPSTVAGGTPGAQNSVYDESPPPVVADTTHTPVLPPAGSSVTITCRAAAYDTDELSEVSLLYRVSTYPEQDWLDVAMEDEGINGDDIGNDGVYSVVIPPYGEDTYVAGTILEFQIRVTDDHSESLVAPGTNTTSNEIGIPDPPYSYLLKFGEDTDFTGEYDTYHILLTERNRIAPGIGLEERNHDSDELIDCTLITSDGDIFYNSGVRMRGGSSRSNTLGGYRIELPKSRQFESYREINLNHLNALTQYMGLEMANRVGAGVKGQEVELSRVWINGVNKQPGHGIYTRIEGFDNHIIHRHYGDDDWGNLYKCDGDGTYDGDLRYTTNLDEYVQNSSGDKYYNYMFTSNNPPDLWTELQDLCEEVNKSGDNLTSITNRVNVRAWARLYALQVCLANDESGWLDPYSTRGDELRIYAHPVTGVFDLFPWDADTMLGKSTSGVWLWNHAATRNFLFHHPMAPYYIGDVLDILDNEMSNESMNELWDSMGSALVNKASVRTGWENTLNALRTNLKNAISTNFTIQVSDVLDSGDVATVVNASTITLSGDFPQNYTAAIMVNGVAAGIDSWDVANMSTTYGTWSTATNGTDLVLGDEVTEVTVETVDSDGNVLLSRDLTIVRKTNSINESGTISTNTTWDSSSGIIVVSDNLDIASGSTLTIASNTTVLIASGKTISVSSGSLVIEGTEEFPVWILPADGSSSWTINAGSQSLTASNAIFAGGTLTANGGTVLLQDCEVRDNSSSGGIITSSGGASLTLRRCIVSGYAKTSFSSSSLLADNCLFADMSDAGIEVISGVATVESSTVKSPAGTGSPDGIRASSSASVLATNCLLHDIAGSGVSALSSSSIECRDGLIHSSGTGIEISGAALVNVNNTIANNTTGIEGSSQSVTNCIIWSNTNSVSSGPSQVQYTDLEQSGTNSYSGTGNLNQNPWFRDGSIADYRMQSFSPCKGSGSGGANMGASFPVGANPPTPSGVSLTNGLASGTNFITLSWTVNDHDDATIEIQRAIEGDDWTTITTLAAGSTNHSDTGLIQNTEYHYRLRASHKRGESFWSDSAILVTANEATTELYKNYLRITEIMYNPDGSDDAEFIEIRNTWSNAMDMTGLFLDEGRYSFATGMVLAAGESFIIARDGIGFSNAYPGVECEGTFTSYDLNLDNGGESLWIKDKTGEKVFEVDYNDAAPWPTSADGDGPSLVLIDPSAPPPGNGEYDYTRWRASTLYGGSPGYKDPNGSVVINEVLSHQDDPEGDWVELHNPGNAPIDISGYYLSDDPADRMKFQIPSTTTVGVGDFVVFNERDDFGPGAIGVNGFAFSELGEAVYLSDTNGTNVASQSFGAAERDFTFGRHTRSDGQVDFVAMNSQTSDATNSYPRVGPVVINEIMYNPAATGKEFVEILNISGSTVPLSVVATNGLGIVFTNGWEFDGAMEFIFPTNTSLESGEHLIITSIDPAEFRTLFGISAGTQVFGPFGGDLNNGGETVELYKPGTPETNGIVPLILVDTVEYDNNLPWPEAADNDGPSLERITPEVYGNEPTNWTASSLGGTPGRSNNTISLPSVGFELVESSGDESNQTVTISVMVYPVSTNGPVTVNYSTTGGTATPVTDYTSTSGSLLFWPYDSHKSITLTIQSDGVALEPDETVELSLDSVSANAVPGGNSLHTYTILDTDVGTLNPPTITPDSTNFFNSIVVSMETDNTNAVIRYTKDGSTPTLKDKRYSLPLTLTASTRIKAKTFLSVHHSSSETSELFLEKTPDRELPADTVAIRISSSSDDAEQEVQPPFGGFPCTLDDANIVFGDDFPTDSPFSRTHAGLRFQNVSIPSGAIVTNAYIQFTSSSSGSGQATHTIYAQAADNPGTFETGQFNISSRTLTDANVTWTPDDWTAPDLAGTAQRSPDLSAVIQEIVDRDGWAESNSVAFIVEYETDEPDSFNIRPTYAYDADPEKAALLYVQYSTNFVPPPYTTQGTAHSWLDMHAPTNILNYEAADYEDWDGDFALNWEEYPAGTIPTNLVSVFKVLSVDYMSGSNRVTWYGTVDNGVTKPFSMYRSTNDLALNLWELIESNSILRDASGTNEWWDVPAPENGPAFYQPAIRPPWDE